MPSSYLYWCELLQKLAPLQTDWEVIAGLPLQVVRVVRDLYNDGRDPDWRLAERIMRDTVPYLTRWILEHLADDRAGSLKAMQLFMATDSMNNRSFVREVRRLASEGVIRAHEKHATSASSDPYKYNPRRYTFEYGEYTVLLDRNRRILL
jgi:hypothetical protein